MGENAALPPTRAVPTAEPLLLRFHPFELDERQARLLRGGQAVALAPKAFEVLCALARAPGQLGPTVRPFSTLSCGSWRRKVTFRIGF